MTDAARKLLLKGRKKLYGQNRFKIIYDNKWFNPSYVESRLFCPSIGTIPLYGKTCVCRSLRGEVSLYSFAFGISVLL